MGFRGLEPASAEMNEVREQNLYPFIVYFISFHKGVPYSNFLAGCPEVKGFTCFKDLAWSQAGG